MYLHTDKKAGSPDPLPVVAPSLLSAVDIARYTLATGMISPFDPRQGKEFRKLKFASYEAGIGKYAHYFDSKTKKLITIEPHEDGHLVIPANSIIFVECDLEFRLPRFIAVRFNLRITHVHRGLLLGTGPLVDPGFWGKLCIPLHNLTSEEYIIPAHAGLIWVEFTKTTSEAILGRVPTNSAALNRDKFDNTRRMVERASQAYQESPGYTPILSSIPEVTLKAKEAADVASADAKKAADDADKAAENASTARSDADDAKRTARNIGIGAGIGGVLAIISILIGLVALWYTFYTDTRNQHKELRQLISDIASGEQTLADKKVALPPARVEDRTPERPEPRSNKSESQKDDP